MSRPLPLCQLSFALEEIELQHQVAVLDVLVAAGCIAEESGGEEPVIGGNQRDILGNAPGEREIGLQTDRTADPVRSFAGRSFAPALMARRAPNS